MDHMYGGTWYTFCPIYPHFFVNYKIRKHVVVLFHHSIPYEILNMQNGAESEKTPYAMNAKISQKVQANKRHWRLYPAEICPLCWFADIQRQTIETDTRYVCKREEFLFAIRSFLFSILFGASFNDQNSLFSNHCEVYASLRGGEGLRELPATIRQRILLLPGMRDNESTWIPLVSKDLWDERHSFPVSIDFLKLLCCRRNLFETGLGPLQCRRVFSIYCTGSVTNYSKLVLQLAGTGAFIRDFIFSWFGISDWDLNRGRSLVVIVRNRSDSV